MVVTLIVLPTCDSNYEACKSLSPQKQCGRTIRGDFFPLLLKYSLVRMKKKISYIIGSFLWEILLTKLMKIVKCAIFLFSTQSNCLVCASLYLTKVI